MDPSAFDRLSRAFAVAPTRRSALAGLTGALATLVARLTPTNTPETAAQASICRPLGGRCFPDRGVNCCRGATCQQGICRCPKQTRRCGNRCLPKSRCCRHRDCPGNQRCLKGRCQCPAGKKRCQGRCIPRHACCRDGECGTHGTCVKGLCRCDRGFKRCGNACIPAGGCCTDSECDGIGEACRNHVCATQTCAQGGPCRVFVTNQTFQGNLGGVAGGDELCQTAADSSVLTQGGIYKAWLSGTTADSSPSMRFTNLDKVGPYVRVDGEIVANDWDDLTTAKGNDFLRARLNLTELGTGHGQTGTWTGTSTAGTPLSDTCDGWTTSASGQGTIGNNLSLIIWTNVGTGGCQGSRPIYCFEQG